MIDVRLVRADADAVKAALARKHVDPADVDAIAALDRDLRDLASRRDQLRAQVNGLSKDVGTARREGDTAKAEELAARSRALGDEETGLAAQATALEADLHQRLLVLPNLPAADAPDGENEHENRVVRTHGVHDDYADHQRVPHWDVGEQLGILDLARGAKISGSMFPVLRGAGAALSRALCQLALDLNAGAFEEIRPPTLVRSDTLTASGQLPKFGDDAYQVERDDLWVIPTAEVPLTSMARDEVLDAASLPMRLMAYTPCLRRESGAAGRDTRGLLRSHEFDKVEIFAYATEEQAPALLEEMVARAERPLQLLGLPYRVLDICTGDLGQSHHRSFDLETYAPGCDQWLEVSSISWFSDYQARRANVRYKPAEGGATRHVHTLNGSALAVPRVLATIIETYRRADGSVVVPDALRPYLRGVEVIEPI